MTLEILEQSLKAYIPILVTEYGIFKVPDNDEHDEKAESPIVVNVVGRVTDEIDVM